MARADTAESQDFRFGIIHNQKEPITKNVYRLFIVVWFGLGFLAAKPCFSQEVAVTNVSFALQDSNVVVHYNLSGPRGKDYRVVLTLCREGHPDFRFRPIDVSGDIGRGDFAGAGRQIVWYLYSDIPDGLPGNGYYFQVTATLLKGGSLAWLYIGGAFVLAGTAAAVIYKSKLSAKPVSALPFPAPPGRP